MPRFDNSTQLCHAYLDAKRFVINAGFAWEVDWQANQSINDVTESFFLREYAWVVFNAGFREKTMRQIFPRIEMAFSNFKSADIILKKKRSCKQRALAAFRHEQKVDAILKTCQILALAGFDEVYAKIKADGVNYLQEFPFMGPATSLHLAKNLGFDVVKPDRHLIRLAEAAGYRNPHEMCEQVHNVVGDSLNEIDIVFWRRATLNQNWIKSVELSMVNSARQSLISILKLASAR